MPTKNAKLNPRAAILWRLTISPVSLSEIEEELHIDRREAAYILRQLIAENKARLLADPRREGGPFYCLAGYQEEESRIERNGLAYDYSAHYENPIDDGGDGTYSGLSWR